MTAQKIDTTVLPKLIARIDAVSTKTGLYELAELLRAEHGARISDTGGNGNFRVRMAGVTAQSTAGLPAAMMAWAAKARGIYQEIGAVMS